MCFFINDTYKSWFFLITFKLLQPLLTLPNRRGGLYLWLVGFGLVVSFRLYVICKVPFLSIFYKKIVGFKSAKKNLKAELSTRWGYSMNFHWSPLHWDGGNGGFETFFRKCMNCSLTARTFNVTIFLEIWMSFDIFVFRETLYVFKTCNVPHNAEKNNLFWKRYTARMVSEWFSDWVTIIVLK